MVKIIDTNKFYFESIVTFEDGEQAFITTSEVKDVLDCIESLREYIEVFYSDREILSIQTFKHINSLNLN